MKFKFSLITIFCLTNLAFALPATDNVSFRESQLTSVSLDIYDEDSIFIYKDNDKKREQYYAIPRVLLKVSRLKKIQDMLEKESNSKKIKTVAFKLDLLTYEVKTEIAQKLNLRREKLNIKQVLPEQISFPSITQIEILAKLSNPTRIKILSSYPHDSSIFETKAISQLQGVNAHERVTITDTVENLKAFFINPKIELRVFTGGFSTNTNRFHVQIKSFLETQIKNDLSGDETLTDRVTFFNQSESGGFSLQTPLGSIGGGDSSNKHGSERILKRVVSRKHIVDSIKNSSISMDASIWIEDDSNDFAKRMEKVIFKLYDSVEMKYDKNEHKFTNEVFNLTLAGGELSTLKEHAKYEHELDIKSKTTATTPKGATTSSDKNFNYKDKSDITWSVEGGKWIPSKISLYQLNHTKASNLQTQSLEVIKATKNSFYLISNLSIEENGEEESSENNQLSGVGNIIASMIPWKFQSATFRSKWIPADGREIPVGSDYEKLRKSQGKEFYFKNEEKKDKLYAPDLRGKFLRGINQFDKSEINKINGKKFGDPDGIRKAGSYQVSMNKSHNHNNGGYSKLLTINGHETIEDADRSHEPNLKSSANIKPSGGAESRPRNVAIYYYIRINK